MPPQLLITSLILLIGAWLLLGDKGSMMEKVTILVSIFFAYAAYRLMSGATPQEILTPFINGIRIRF